jgi:hypothetical protein
MLEMSVVAASGSGAMGMAFATSETAIEATAATAIASAARIMLASARTVELFQNLPKAHFKKRRRAQFPADT